MIKKKEIRDIILAHREEIRSLGVRRVGLFGSFVRNEEGPISDVDILVDFETDKKTFDNFIQLAFFLEDLLGLPVEVVTRESLSPHIGPHILREVEDVPLAA